MSQVIRIADSVYRRLETHAIGFDTPSKVIERLLNYYEKRSSNESNATLQSSKPADLKEQPTQLIELDPNNPEDLTYTKIIDGDFAGEKFRNWNELVYLAHKYALEHSYSLDELKTISNSNIINGNVKDNGYRPYTDIGISIQGESANKAWQSAFKISKNISISHIEIIFEWRNKSQAAHPGDKGRIQWRDNNNSVQHPNSNSKTSADPENFPDYDEIEEPLLNFIYFNGGDDCEVKPTSTYGPLADYFNLSEEQRSMPRPDGYSGTYWQNKLQWVRQRLVNKGEIDANSYGIWKLTQQGIQRAENCATHYEVLKVN